MRRMAAGKKRDKAGTSHDFGPIGVVNTHYTYLEMIVWDSDQAAWLRGDFKLDGSVVL